MTSSLDMIRGRSNVVTLTNKSGGPLVAGDVCVIDTSNDESATTTTSAASVLKVYIAAESIASNATGKFYSGGFCPLVTPSASVTRGRYLFTHTVAKQAAENATYGSGAFGVILKSGTTPSVWLFGTTAQGSGGGAGSDTTAIHSNAASEISAITEKTSLTGNDLFLIEDSADSNNKKRVKQSNLGGGGAPTTSEYITAAPDAGLSAEIVIPGLAGSPDIAPAGANDDEFSALSGWTTLGTLDVSNVTDFKSLWHVKKATGGVEVNGIYKAIPTIPFTVTTHIKFADLRAAAHPSCGIMLLDATPTAIRCFEINQVSATLYMSLRRYTNRTTFSTSVDAVLLSGVVAYTEVPDVFLRVLVTSTSNVTFSYSTNGLFYIPVTGVTAIDPTITVTYVGLEISDPIGASTTEAAIDWIRFT